LIHIYSDDEYISDNDNRDYIDEILCYQELSHSEIIERCDFSNSHISNARLSSDKSILQEEHIMIDGTEMQDSTLNGKDLGNIQRNTNKTYSTMLKLISEAMVGGTDYSEIYETCGIDKDDTSTARDNTSNNTDKDSSNQHHKIPTLQEVTRKVARLEKIELDEKQYIAYEMIACTFVLGLVRDGNDANTTLFTSLQKTMGGESSQEIADIVRKLEARGGQEQLLLFLTGPAGSGKSTAMRVAEQFCYEFCMAVGVMWGDRTFLFTAYTGSAASLIGGVTISKAAYLNLQRQLNDNDINEWKDVKILVIDEVSFMSDSTLKKLNRQLT
jgi:hypothetical protein